MMAHSIFLIVTGSALIPRTQAPWKDDPENELKKRQTSVIIKGMLFTTPYS